MIRLVTQFDSPSARPSLATPTCAGCSCCCCCVATVLTTSIYTSMSAHAAVKQREREGKSGWRSPWPQVVGACVLLIAAGIGVAAGLLYEEVGVLAALVAWVVVLGAVYTGARASRPWLRAVIVPVVTILAFFVELIVALVTLGPIWPYLLFVVVVTVGATMLFRRRLIAKPAGR